MSLFEWVFGKSVTPQERLKKNQRALERTQRELEREKRKLEAQEKKLIQDIKKAAKNNQISAAKIKAKDLVRTRSYVSKFNNMQTQLQAISLRIQAVRSSDQMSSSMREATVLLAGMNRSMNLPQLQKISMEFEKQNELMDQRQEFIDEAIDGVMEDDEFNEDEEADEIVNKVLDEIGVDLNTELANAPNGQLGSAVGLEESHQIANPKSLLAEGGTPGGGPSDPDSDLQARLDSLKRQ
ncbi:similar to Saccharomyces cerevisiae YKL002W DID4 Class E Vps protein of the ESCRT- III complex [Maudiozyma barnettii]|uniref:Similar to Saccharomyces cerevisiae YKL002W DID4 Class E Vps protein of the ESCRT- III complex n=1 Tax=Maudiozyma barnettii TaxID=61262 RepID=A0A8H2VJ75_9SACH|nr:ESCRT-III subunit protein DID4 [Kazachstania barnettii]CAB4256393.1 similar to Saccharomyces cerevisiae YKL002W DID4 Class E Vps protein of the ESCRT- III complex [Kazachstania barnettii]CAD1785002.1 similar to Saccharomyces cerevisiae YKL002W DID4 Class E Vps protein of the ESCRT- III complex [Kazachstania barnettii]